MKYSKYEKYKIDKELFAEDDNGGYNTILNEPTANDVEVSSPCTRSAISSPSHKQTCFVCNIDKNDEKTYRISKVSLASETEKSINIHLDNPNSASCYLDLL